MANAATRVVVEILRQVGTGVREYLRDRRRREISNREIKVRENRENTELIKALIVMGFSKDKAIKAADSKEVCAVSQKPLVDQVRVALAVLTP